ncbi:uncharacterized protein LOC120846193 [Ixodes scapularis]|uniref:uncharacterized protein LOC120846193 n=1 Tax=Ixodes scapularis TaxID=6945 RepID=UPI001C38328F|nr:uncharacterized protein LOC120846193 [Ixodes scapularis]
MTACPSAPDPLPSHQAHTDVDGLPESCPRCNVFYTDFVLLSSAAAAQLERQTRGTTNALWHESRGLRVTASNIVTVPKMPHTAHERAVLSLTSRTFRGNAAIRRGQNFEPIARAQFVTETGLSVSLCGTVVCSEVPFLSATPDGIIQSCNAILKIKCPDTDDCKALIARGGYEVKSQGDKFFLNPEHDKGFYSQVQFTMLCTRKTLCFFYVWSPCSVALFTVLFNEQFIAQNMAHLTKFYFSSMLPYLEQKYRKGSLQLSSDYRRLTQM